MASMLSDEQIRDLLSSAKTIAVVGLSPNPERESHSVAARLKAAGYRIIPVNPGHDTILGEKAYASLGDVPEAVDIVDIFRRSEAVPEVVDDAITIGAKCVWMQLGVVHEEAARRAESAGLLVVMDRCLATAHALLKGSSSRPA